jgi:hypothetical protein
MRKQHTEGQRAHRHAEQQHGAEKRDDLRTRPLGRQVGRQGKTDRLHRMEPRPDQQKRERGRGLADDDRARGVAGEDEQRERHDGEAAELQHRAKPDERNSPPAQNRTMGIRAEPDQSAERRDQQRQRKHDRDDPRGNREFDDHHAIERANQKDRRHADSHLEQRQPDQTRHREFGRRGVRERQNRWVEAHQLLDDGCARAVHRRRTSIACET